MYEENRCGLCSRGPDEHQQLEQQGLVNHKFSENGDLQQLERPAQRRAQPQQTPKVIGAIDIDLRRILLKKGLITNEDFAALYDPRAGAAGDREAGETQSSG